MAIATDNILVRNIYGGLGGQVVFRQRGDMTIMAKWPTIDKDRKPTPGQATAREAFQAAVYFAQQVRRDETLSALYQKLARKGQSIYHAAISDAKKAPELNNPQLLEYFGRPGDPLTITASDNYSVARVLCSIFTPDGQLLESGAATEDAVAADRWTYITTCINSRLAGTTIRFSAFDIPENETVLSITL